MRHKRAANADPLMAFEPQYYSGIDLHARKMYVCHDRIAQSDPYWGDENCRKIGQKNPLSFFLLQSP